MALFREVTFEIDGQEYTLTPSNKLLRRIEGQGVTLAGISNMAASGNPPISHVAFLIWMMAKEGGYAGSEDDILSELQMNPDQAASWAEVAFQAFTPVVDEKKPEPQAVKLKPKTGR